MPPLTHYEGVTPPAYMVPNITTVNGQGMGVKRDKLTSEGEIYEIQASTNQTHNYRYNPHP